MSNLLDELIKLRHELHQYPEVSGQEGQTTKRILHWLETCSPTQIITELGGHGIAAIFDSGQKGPSVLLRCELDALPIYEVGQPQWRSKSDGVGHLCGHDGHMSIMAGLARNFSDKPPKSGRVILLFQPAEEDGAGARAVIADPKFHKIKPDYSFALHNLPGMPLNHVGIKSGPLNFASEGLRIELSGKTSHASHPEDGTSPANAIAALIQKLPHLPKSLGKDESSALVTVVHASLGVNAFGVAPGDGLVMATLRSIDNALQSTLMAHAEELARQEAERHGLSIKLTHGEKFSDCTNDSEAADFIRKSARQAGRTIVELTKPYRWSEDFGLFGSISSSALFVLGAGENTPQLHNPDYDFPDKLIPTGMELFENIARDLCG
ncbi:MAG: amidohydrolase [Lentilitoribacter sp.]